MKKFRKLIIFLLLIGIIVIIYCDNYDNLKYSIQALLNNTLSFASGKSNDLERIISNGKLISDSEVSSLKDSGINGEDYSSNAKYYPYYELLSSNEKTLYKQVYANIDKFATTFIPVTTVNATEVKNAIEAVYNDHPELFWLNTNYSYKYTKNSNVVQIILSFNETANNIDEAKSNFNYNANKIISAANKLSTSYEKEKYVHDSIIGLVSYNLNAKMNQSAYSALVNGSTVCAGYSRAFQYIMIELGIPTYYVTGSSNGDHAWNIVLLSDGYYNVDLTWDDTDPISYTYFNLTDNDFSKTHKRTDSSLFLPTCSATTYRKLEISSKSNIYNSRSNSNANVNSNESSNSDMGSNYNTGDSITTNDGISDMGSNIDNSKEIDDTSNDDLLQDESKDSSVIP